MTLKNGKNLETRMWELEEEVRKNTRWRRIQQAISAVSLIITGMIWIYLFLLIEVIR